ncbi:MAG: hypothetical protein H0X41_08325 [Chitinophagaceae bacterium]|nr:hypothetical protein [Chitinophagaceae bacterium]
MAEFKRRTLFLSTGKQIKLFGNSLAIGKSLQIGEGYAPNVFFIAPENQSEKSAGKVANPFQLAPGELMEIADFNIQLWMDLKANIRKFGIEDVKLFNQETIK